MDPVSDLPLVETLAGYSSSLAVVIWAVCKYQKARMKWVKVSEETFF